MRVWKMALATGLLIVGCGDDEGDAGGSLDGKKVSELNGVELKQLCDYFEGVGDNSISDEQFCTQDAADWSESVEECEEYRDECLADEEALAGDDCSEFSVDKRCTVQVGVLKACVSDLIEAWDAAARTASCDDFEAAQVDELPSSCDDVPDECLVVEVSNAPLRAALHAR